MRLCLSCYRLWPRGAVYCGTCARSFEGRLCPARHISPAGARACIHCGATELTETVASLPLGWLTSLIAAAVVFGIAGLVLRHLGWGLTAMVWLLAHLLGVEPHDLVRAVNGLISWAITGAILLQFLPPAQRHAVMRFVSSVYRSALRLVQFLLKRIVEIVIGRRA